MKEATVQIKTILVAETALVAGQDLYVGREPAKPHNIVTIFDTPDRGKMLFADKDDEYEYAAVQARIRNARYDAAMQQARDITDLLHNRGNEIIGDTKVTLIEALDNPFLLDWDENNRARVVVNFAVQQTPVPSV